MRVEQLSDDVRLVLGDCREVLPTLGKFDAVVTDPPYGCGKADWDETFPTEWWSLIEADIAVVITGSSGLRDSIALVGADFVDVIAARNLNGMTRGPIGFGNWLAAVVAKGKPRPGINAFDFSVSGDMPDHPSPKPLPYMLKLVERLTKPGDRILDCFMGSGTTGVAAVRLGRAFTGVENAPAHFDTARARLTEELRRPRLLVERPAPERQEALL